MKKLLPILLTLALIFSAFSIASAETETPEFFTLEGIIDSIDEDGNLLLLLPDDTQVLALKTDETTLEGVEELYAGLFVQVVYDGKITRSLPGQLTALHVSSYCVMGEVTEVVLSTGDDAPMQAALSTSELGDILVNLPEGTQEAPEKGETLRVFYNGAATMSLPAQISALRVEKVYTLSGTVAQMTENGALLNTEDCGQVEVLFAPGLALPVEGEEIIARFNGVMTASLPGQINCYWWETVPGENAR